MDKVEKIINKLVTVKKVKRGSRHSIWRVTFPSFHFRHGPVETADFHLFDKTNAEKHAEQTKKLLRKFLESVL